MSDDFPDEIAEALAPGRDIPAPARDQLWRDVSARRARVARPHFRRRVIGVAATMIAASIILYIVGERQPASPATNSAAARNQNQRSSAESSEPELARLTESERLSVRIIDRALAQTSGSTDAKTAARVADERSYLLSLRKRVLARGPVALDGAE